MAGQNGSTSVSDGIEKLLEGPETDIVSWKSLKMVALAIIKALPVPGTWLKAEEGPHGRTFHVTLEIPKHPWQLYPLGNGFAVYPANVQLDIMPTMDGVPLNDSVAPVTEYLGGDLDFYLEFDATAASAEGIGGVYQLISGSQILSNVEVTPAGGTTTPIEVDPDTGIVTDGHYVVLIGSVRDGRVTAQNLRFSVNFNLCAGGGMEPKGYG